MEETEILINKALQIPICPPQNPCWDCTQQSILTDQKLPTLGVAQPCFL